MISTFIAVRRGTILHLGRGKVHIDPNAQEGALKCEIRACHFVRFRKNVPKRNVKKNNEGIFKNYEGILKIPS